MKDFEKLVERNSAGKLAALFALGSQHNQADHALPRHWASHGSMTARSGGWRGAR